MIGQTVFGRSLLHDARDRRIVDVADIGKKMVLDLEIQSAAEEVERPATNAEIGGRSQLMFRPGMTDSPILR